MMRGRRTFIAITLFLLFLAGLSLLVYEGIVRASGPGGASADVGRIVFGFVSATEMLMLVVIAPSLTAGTIASERQHQTFDMLMATPLTPGQVLRGKLLASMTYLFLLMFASLPINAIVFLFGGVSPATLLWWVALVLTTLLLLGTLGLLMSTLFRSSGVATGLTYLIVVSLFLVFPIGFLFVTLTFGGGSMSRLGECAALGLFLLHPAGGYATILVNDNDWYPLRVLPALLPLYGSLAGLLFLGAEARLARLTAQRGRTPLWLVVPLLVTAVAVAYVALGPTRAMCSGF